MTNKEFADLVYQYGNDVSLVVRHINSNNLDDPELRDLCDRARPLLMHLDSIVDRNRTPNSQDGKIVAVNSAGDSKPAGYGVRSNIPFGTDNPMEG
jgi:hypothetical protein